MVGKIIALSKVLHFGVEREYRRVSTEVDTKSTAHALVIALTLLSESAPKIGGSPHPRSEREILGGCRTFGVNLCTASRCSVTDRRQHWKMKEVQQTTTQSQKV